MTLPYVVAQPCLDVLDRSCIDECPVDCIYEGPRMVFIHPLECVDCAACLLACPVDAIFPAEELPPRWQHYEKLNAAFFEAIGSPGGASLGRADTSPEEA